MIARKAEKYIKRWIRESNKAFLVSGARQVGKTFTVRRCLVDEKANYRELIRYNVFRIEMLVRHASDGKMYLYDMVNVKKEKETSTPPQQ